MKRYNIVAAAVALAVLLAFFSVHFISMGRPVEGVMKVGFIYENDESTPETYNYSLAQRALEMEYPGRLEVLVKSNVIRTEAEKPLREMAQMGCGVIFTNVDTETVAQVAAEYPGTQFCQESYTDVRGQELPENYHTFNGKIYQGRYVSGIAAGMKLRQLIDEGIIREEEALVGFVGSYATAAERSDYTAFLLGVRSVAPEAKMLVKYTGAGSNYSREKACAKSLIELGCVVIAQHTPTIGPAVACEESARSHVYHVGYHQSVVDVAPTTSLVSTRINWTPYVVQAVGAVLDGKRIESRVIGDVHGRDVCAGFERGWVEMLDLNPMIAAEGTQEKMDKAIAQFKKGKLEVFKGNYLGVNPDDPADTCDLNRGYHESSDFSLHGFNYVLKDVVTELE